MSRHGGGMRRVIGLAATLGAVVILGCMDRSMTGPTLIGTADSLQVSSGNNQSGVVSTALSTPLTVQVRTATGAAVAGTSVAFSVTSGGGSVSPAVVATDAMGRAQASWTLGANTGLQTLTATAGAKVITLTATGIAAGGTGGTGGTTSGGLPAAQVVLNAGNGQSGAIGQPLGANVVVKVLDSLGGPVPGATVTFAQGAGNGTGGSVSPTSIKSDAAGLATTQWTLGSKVGQQTLTATVAGLTAVTVQATGTMSASGAAIVDNGNNQVAGSGAVLPTFLRVLVVDQAGNPALGARVSWAVATGGGAISKSSGTTNTAGLDSAKWTLGPSIGTQTVTATVSGVGSVTYTAAATTVSGTPSTLRIISGEGQAGQSAQTLSLPLVVEVRDAGGNVLSGVTVGFTQAATNADALTSPSPAVTGVDGRASVTWRLGSNTGTTAQTDSVTASLTGFPAIAGVVFHSSVRPAFRIRLVNIVDTLQTDTTGATLRDTLVVQVFDPVTNLGVQGVSIGWATQASSAVDGFAINSVDTTDNTGLAKNRWVLRGIDGAAIPSSSVAKRMVATVAGIGQVEFKAHVYPGALRTITTNVSSSAAITAGNAVTWCATGKDVTGNVVDSVTLTFAGSGGGATVSSSVLSTYNAATCLSSTITTAGSWGFTVSGTAQVRPYAQTSAVTAVASGTVVVSPAGAAVMTKTAGDAQTGARSSILPTPLKVLVKDSFGNIVPGQAVAFAVVGGGGLLSAGAAPAATATVTTGADGSASVTLILGGTAGTNTVVATAGGGTVIFTATGTP